MSACAQVWTKRAPLTGPRSACARSGWPAVDFERSRARMGSRLAPDSCVRREPLRLAVHIGRRVGAPEWQVDHARIDEREVAEEPEDLRVPPQRPLVGLAL